LKGSIDGMISRRALAALIWGAVAVIAAADRDDKRGTAPACNGGCCTSGCSCCVPMTLAEPEAGWPLLANALDIIAPAPSTHAGIEPEAPAKPPKSIT
jgi:hypothetical protein